MTARTNSRQRRAMAKAGTPAGWAQAENGSEARAAIEAKIAGEKARWAQVEAQLKENYQIQFGAHQGRLSVFGEMLKALEEEEAQGRAETPPADNGFEG